MFVKKKKTLTKKLFIVFHFTICIISLLIAINNANAQEVTIETPDFGEIAWSRLKELLTERNLTGLLEFSDQKRNTLIYTIFVNYTLEEPIEGYKYKDFDITLKFYPSSSISTYKSSEVRVLATIPSDTYRQIDIKDFVSVLLSVVGVEPSFGTERTYTIRRGTVRTIIKNRDDENYIRWHFERFINEEMSFGTKGLIAFLEVPVSKPLSKVLISSKCEAYRESFLGSRIAPCGSDKISVDIPQSSTPEESTKPLELVGDAIKNLESKNSIVTRLAGIRDLEVIGINETSSQTQRLIMDELEQYIRRNIANSKRKAEGIKEYLGTFRADDIVAALEALQAIRGASGEMQDVDLRDINFDRVNLSYLNLSGFDFSHSTFRNSFLSGSNMKNANFDHANLSGSVFWSSVVSDMTNASFHQANLYQVKFANVNLTGSNIEESIDKRLKTCEKVRGLTGAQRQLFPMCTSVD